MTEQLSRPAEKTEEQAGNYDNNAADDAIFAYNLNDGETPGKLKVRWKVRVATGPEARRLDARQADAIRELLQWAARYSHRAT